MTGSAGTAVPKEDRDEDSGLHDIRNLAAASRSRMSSRRIGTNPPPVDEDILASTSGSWKSIALPEPAKMVSLPEIAELPKIDAKAQAKADKAAAKLEAKARKSRPSGQIEMPVVAPVVADPIAKVEAPLQLDDVPSVSSSTAKGATSAAVGTAKGAATVTPMIGARIAQANKKSKAPMIALVGIGLAAAAGAAIYLGTRGGDTNKTDVASTTPDLDLKAKDPAPAPAVAPVVEPIKEEPKEEPAPAPADVAKEEPVPVEPPTAKTVKQAKPSVTKKPAKATIEVDDPGNGVKPAVKKEEPPKKEPAKEGDPDFEQLLQESGYQKKDDAKPKLEKKSLSGGDFKTGMAGISGKAQGCYKGTQGTAMVKLTIAPNGSVSKVAVTGVGAAEAACVSAAVRGATFPPWDGGPQSFNYSYLLSE